MKKALIVIVALALLFFMGPKVEQPSVDGKVPEEFEEVDLGLLNEQISNSEKNTDFIKPDNESRIIFADSIPEKTEFVLLYIHGFSASPHEGYPLNEDFAQRYHMNAYFPRLHEHGLETPHNLLDMTPDKLIESSKDALKVARQLGDKVILMSTSTGGTLSLILAADNPDIAGVILYSPNIEMAEDMTKMLTFPWGLQIGKLAQGEMIEYPDDPPLVSKYWQSTYRVEAVAYLQSLVENTMTIRTFEKVTQPIFLGYYFKDAEHQDGTVKVSAMLDMYEHLGTPENQKIKYAFTEVGVHPLASDIKSKDIASVKRETFKFAEEILQINPN
ncbi:MULTISPECIES: carboxylesterase [unclassified Lentimicrobium]|uniref:alpha/beta hydrolase n=1 Tax=unclassified Lentimicrobium TaxID=2677434 RepID=UPI0015535E2B|nr:MULTISPECIES: alpha/beta hydrolase [unclassified Lentimicrobium]NPD44772.1 alpha/beta hydrolase [Lentimicrobium sp. S6]NPD83372.1 alpha/beta hydrolase [Lentimicrobium sp. L6]